MRGNRGAFGAADEKLIGIYIECDPIAFFACENEVDVFAGGKRPQDF